MRAEYEKGYNRIEKDEDDEILLNQAIEKASESKEVVLFVRLTENYESEGVDRNNIDLSKNKLTLSNSLPVLIFVVFRGIIYIYNLPKRLNKSDQNGGT